MDEQLHLDEQQVLTARLSKCIQCACARGTKSRTVAKLPEAVGVGVATGGGGDLCGAGTTPSRTLVGTGVRVGVATGVAGPGLGEVESSPDDTGLEPGLPGAGEPGAGLGEAGVT